MGELFSIFLNNIAPILLITGIAFIVGKRYELDPRPLGRMVFLMFSPALIFDSLAKSEVSVRELGQIAVVMTVFVAVMLVIGFAVSRFAGVDRIERASILLSAICPNNGNFGLPLISFAFGEDVLARAVLVFVCVSFLNYTVGIFIASNGRQTMRVALASVLQVPVIYAAMAGLAVNLLEITLPPLAQRSVTLLGQAAVPCMIALLGLQMARAERMQKFKWVGLGVGLRLLASPVLAGLLILLFQLEGPARIAVLMQASMPVAVATLIFTTEYGLDAHLMSNMIMASTLLSPITLSVLIYLLRIP